MKWYWNRHSSKPRTTYCFFCPQKTLIDPHSLICPVCEQYNGVEDNQPPPQQPKHSSSPKRFCVPLRQTQHSFRNFLCWECYQKQELWRKAIANIHSCSDDQPSDDMQLTRYEKRELERIEQSYDLCQFCKATVQQRLSWMDQKLSSQWYLNFHMSRCSISRTTHSKRENRRESCLLWLNNLIALVLFMIGYILSSQLYMSSSILFRLVPWLIMDSIYKWLYCPLLYPYLFCGYCILSSILLYKKWLWYNRTSWWIYEIGIGGLYLLLLWKRRNTSTKKQSFLSQSWSHSSSSDTLLLTDRLYPLPQAISTLSLEDNNLSSLDTLQGNSNGHSTRFSIRFNSFYQRWKNRFSYSKKNILVFLFLVIRILGWISLPSSSIHIELCLNVTSWIIFILIGLYPCSQCIHIYQQIAHQTSYHPFDSKLYQQWKHPLCNSLLLYGLQSISMAYFMMNMFWRDISPWVETISQSVFWLHLNTYFKQLVYFLLQEYDILLSIVLCWITTIVYKSTV